MTGLFDEPPSNGTPTSNAAAEAIKPSAATLRAKVLAHIQSCGDFGATDDEIQAALDMGGSTERPRRGELADARVIVPMEVLGSIVTRKTRSGRQAIVWRTV